MNCQTCIDHLPELADARLDEKTAALARAHLEEDLVPGCIQGVRPQQIGQHTALYHLVLNLFRRQADAHRDRRALTNLVLQNTQGLIERGNQEVDYAIADGLLWGGKVRRGRQSCGAGNVARHYERAALPVESTGVEQPSAQLRLLAGARVRGGNQARIETLHLEDEVECSWLDGIERQGKILSAIQFEPPPSPEVSPAFVPAGFVS